jgi:TonB-linked SusC/RagA family outer membrane protein
MNFKKYIYLLCCLFLFSGARANSVAISTTTEENNISLDLKNVEIIKVLTALEEKTKYTFVFDETISDSKKRITIAAKNEKLNVILNTISSKTGLEFRTINNTISVIKNPETQQSVRGKVKDKDGFPLPGATIIEKGTKNSVVTDLDGNFSLTVTKTPLVLLVSYIGFESKEITVNNNNFQEITLFTSSNALNEVVVTALGIKRKQKQLGFSQQTIDADNLSQATSNNWSSGLKGKVAGLNIISSGSGPLNSQQITLRGNNSLDPNGNNALIIVDGTPVNSEMTSAGSGSTTAYMGSDSPVDFGNGISDINLEDIENVTVLKGPGASALYGSRAANGVLIITTKSGKKNKGLGITYNTGVTLDVIQRWPDYQYEYGQGTGKSFNAAGDPYYSYGGSADGPNTGSTSSAWGPKFDGQYFFQYDPLTEGQGAERTLWQPYKNNNKDYWRTGMTINNDVTLQGGDKNGSMRMSIGHSKNEWIMPNTGFEKISASVNANYKISDKVKIASVINYTNRTSDNLPSTGYNNGTVAYFSIFQNPNIDLDWYRPIWKKGQNLTQQLQPVSSFIDNPFLIAYESTNSLASSQIVGNLSATIQLAPNLDLLLRTALNTYNQDREQKRPYSINRFAKGFYRTQNVFKQEVNTDFLLTYKKDITNTFSLSASAGGNAMSYKYQESDVAITDLVVPDVYKLSNGVNSPIIDPDNSRKKVNSLYGLVTMSYKDQIFLDVTGRNDWSSTLPKQNNSFFYPSINTSFILSEILNLPASIEYLKYRFSIAQVGNDTDPYKTSKYYSQSAFPSSAVAPTTLFNASFKPEITTSFETGFEGRLFNNRINFDATVYQSTTKNQITAIPLDITTGYSEGIMNSGEVRNRGIELTFTGKVINNKKFKWATTLTWSKNWNEVMKLADGIEGRQTIGSAGTATIIAIEGGTTTAIYGFGFERSPEGKIIYNSSGLPVYPNEVQYIGDAAPDWKAGWQNSFKFGNLSLSVLLDGKYGGIIYSQTHHKLTEMGKLNSTLSGREEGVIVGDGVVLNQDGTYSPNTKAVLTPDWYASYYRRANIESNSFDASYLKLREVSLKYSFPSVWLKNTGVTSLDLSVFGRDLAMISDFPIYDPETAALNGGTILPGIEMGQMPSPASYGFNLKVNF